MYLGQRAASPISLRCPHASSDEYPAERCVTQLVPSLMPTGKKRMRTSMTGLTRVTGWTTMLTRTLRGTAVPEQPSTPGMWTGRPSSCPRARYTSTAVSRPRLYLEGQRPKKAR